MSTGLTSVNVATYSTLPLELRGASLMSVMIAFFGSFGIELAVNLAGDLFERADAFGAARSSHGGGLNDLEAHDVGVSEGREARSNAARPSFVIDLL